MDKRKGARVGRRTARVLSPLPPIEEQDLRLAELEAWPWRSLSLAERFERERLVRARRVRRMKLTRQIALVEARLAELRDRARLYGVAA